MDQVGVVGLGELGRDSAVEVTVDRDRVDQVVEGCQSYVGVEDLAHSGEEWAVPDIHLVY